MVDNGRPKVLLVDDEEGILRALKRLLKDQNVEVATASNGTSAIELMGSNRFALIISDQRMPGMTGVELLQRSRELSPDTIRILLTGYADIDATVNAINNGSVRYYFNKPWDDEFLVSRIRESLELFETTRENRRLQQLTKRQNEELKELNENLQLKVSEQTAEIRAQHQELNQSFMETIKAFSTLIELRSKDTGSHSQRVAVHVKAMLEGQDLNEKEYQDVVVAAYLHDIGKVSLPDKILDTPLEKLSLAERDQYHRHPMLGQACVFKIGGFEEIGVIIRHHHEHYDGSGFPDQLTEKRIPLGARIIRLCDAFDRYAYGAGFPTPEKINEAAGRIVQYSGSEFDPDLVKRFIDYDIARRLYHDESTNVRLLRPDQLKEEMVVARDIKTRNGMFLLPKNAKLTSGMIARINKINAVDPLAEPVRVYV